LIFIAATISWGLGMATEKLNTDQDIGEMESEEEFLFPPAERKLITQPIDLSVQTLAEQWRQKVVFAP
jgi:hypothetical protein